MYDGVTGLFLQPYNGARKNGAVGLVQGVGKGIGGFVLKDLAAVIGPFGYTLKGVHKEMIKSRQPTAFICRARILQGVMDARSLDEMAKEREMTKIDAAWRIISEIRKEEETLREEGLKGRVAVLKEKRKMPKNGGYETVGQAKKALEMKQEERKEWESMAAAGSSGDERRGSRLFGKRGSLLPSSLAKHGDDKHGTVKGADRNVQGEVLDLGKRKDASNGAVEHPGSGMANGTVEATA